MRYHNILHDDMRNGEGLRVTLFVSGCNHYCKECHNKETWDPNSGIDFDLDASKEIEEELSKEEISGLTLSGGDPLYEDNLKEIYELVKYVKYNFPDKNIWLYSGYNYETIFESKSAINSLRQNILNLVDVFVDGEFKIELLDINYKWAGSTNQRVIDMNKTRKTGKIELYNNNI